MAALKESNIRNTKRLDREGMRAKGAMAGGPAKPHPVCEWLATNSSFVPKGEAAE
jgi:hypothetical protein